jgi:Tfp pilus assembly protein PilX
MSGRHRAPRRHRGRNLLFVLAMLPPAALLVLAGWGASAATQSRASVAGMVASPSYVAGYTDCLSENGWG